MPNLNEVKEAIEAAEADAIAVYAAWKKTARRAAAKPIPIDQQGKLRTSDAGVMLVLIAEAILKARADQAEHDKMPAEYVLGLRQAAVEMSRKAAD